MPKPEWGTKQLCPECGAKFYDFKKDPIHCPKCDHEWPQAAPPKPRRGAKAKAQAAEAEQPDDDEEEAEIEDDEDDIEDDGTESLDEVASGEKKAVRKRVPGLDEDDDDDDDDDDLPDLGDDDIDADLDDDDDDDTFLSDNEDDEDDDLSDVIRTGKGDDE